MDLETYKTLLVFSGAMISLLLGIIGYFLNKQIKIVETLVTVVNSLDTSVKLLQKDQSNYTQTCDLKHLSIASSLSSITGRISQLERNSKNPKLTVGKET